MVTVELVFGMMIVTMMLALFGWAVSLFGIQAMCIDSASDIARQAARGDRAAVDREKASAPKGSVIDIDTSDGEVRVVVKVRSKPLDLVPGVTLEGSASAAQEPGES
ncbi:MAG TPA: TadE family type IV pilus minor pilin [Microlunatus sp.]